MPGDIVHRVSSDRGTAQHWNCGLRTGADSSTPAVAIYSQARLRGFALGLAKWALLGISVGGGPFGFELPRVV